MWNFTFFFNSILLGVGLAMDAFSVSLANGMNEPCMKRRKAVTISGIFGLFQGLMPLIGWVCVHTVLQYFKEFEKFLDYYSDFKEDSKPLTLGKALNWLLNEWVLSYENPEDYIIKDKIVGKRYKQNIPGFGNHCYVLKMDNKETYLMISDIKFHFLETVQDTKKKLKNIIDSYGKRTESALVNNSVDWKAISHCVRVILQVEELLTTNQITFPLINANFVKEIKYNTSQMSYEEIMKWIEGHIWHIEEVLLPKSNLRDKADYKWIENFILNCYKQR